MTSQTLVLSGVGPSVKVRLSGNKDAHIGILNRDKVKTVTISQDTDIKFAA